MQRIIFVFFLMFVFCETVRRRRPHGSTRACKANHPCTQRCVNYQRRDRCTCVRGFALSKRNRKDCTDINECSSNNGRCHHICTNIPGGYHCSCRPGYRLAKNQRSCVREDPSVRCPPSHQCRHFCNVTSSGRVCSCRNGYRLHSNGRDCIRLCLYGNGGCQHICNKEADRMFCSCHPHHVLDENGRTCTVQHTCAVDNGGCNADCEDTPIGVQCSCSSGYRLRGDRRSCQDVDECAVENGGCQHGCRNSPGSYICTCPTGFKLAPDEKSCVDIDECLHNDTCWSGCVNSPGSYECTCHEGFQKFAVKRCGDIDECWINNGGCTHTCMNKKGGYECACNDGYKLHWNKKDCVRKTKCFNARRMNPPPALLRCQGRLCLLDCRTESVFRSYYTPRPAYKYTCGRQPSMQTRTLKKRQEHITDRTLWPKQSMYLNNTLPDCADQSKLKFLGNFRISVDHCHLLRQPARQALSMRNPRGNCNAKCRQVRKPKLGRKMLGLVKKSIKKQMFRIASGTAHLQVKRRSTSRRGPRPIPGIHSPSGCLFGSIRNPLKRMCTLCDSGTFFDVVTSACVQCPRGTYQQNRGQLTCHSCPRPSDVGVGLVSSTTVTQCPGLCPSGHLSADGFLPCQPCPLGTYQPETGRIGCLQCGNGLSTRSAGSTSFSACTVRAVCTAGHYYNVETASCRRCPTGFYQPNAGQNFCLSCPGNTTTDYDASESVESCKDTRCGGVIGDLHGVIESPNYPGEYPINKKCVWEIKPPKKRKLLLVIPEIFLPGENCEDSLIMKSKKGASNGKVTYQSCQTFENPYAVTARSKRLFIEFRSNDNVGAKGFQIPYVTYDENYDEIIQDIVRDFRLFSPDHHQNILKSYIEGFTYHVRENMIHFESGPSFSAGEKDQIELRFNAFDFFAVRAFVLFYLRSTLLNFYGVMLAPLIWISSVFLMQVLQGSPRSKSNAAVGRIVGSSSFA